MFLEIFVVKNLSRVFSNFRRVFSKTLFSSFKNCVVYLAIFVVYLAKPYYKIFRISRGFKHMYFGANKSLKSWIFVLH